VSAHVLTRTSRIEGASAEAGPRHAGSLQTSTLFKLFIPVAVFAIAARIYVANVVLPDGLCDDCYTTLRYAANLSEGKGFVFNAGESVWGTTTPLFTLLLWPVAWLFGAKALEIATVASGIAASAVFWSLLLVILEKQRVPRLVSLPALLLVMFSPGFFSNSLSGMETPLVLALMAASFYCYMEDRPIGLGILFGLLLLARIDTLVWIGIVGLAYIIRHYRAERRNILVALSTFFLVALPWHVFALVKFHSLIPQTVTAKAITNNVLHESYGEYIVELCRVYLPGGGMVDTPPRAIAVFTLLAIGGIAIWRQCPLLRPLPVFLLALVACLVFFKVQRFPWYFPPSQWVAYLLGLAGVYLIWNQGLARGQGYAVQAIPFAILSALFAIHCVRGDHYFYQDRAKHNTWIDLANYVTEHTAPDDRIFLEHIGLIGLRSKRPILDNIGLVSPEIVEIRKRCPERWFQESLQKYRPEVAILYGWDLPDYEAEPWSKEDRDWFLSTYTLVNTIEIKANLVTYVYVDNDRLTGSRRAGSH